MCTFSVFHIFISIFFMCIFSAKSYKSKIYPTIYIFMCTTYDHIHSYEKMFLVTFSVFKFVVCTNYANYAFIHI